MKHLQIIMIGFLLGLLMLSTTGQAQDDLAKKSQNPVGDLVSLPFENNTYFGIGPSDAMANALLFKPVYPVKFGKVNLINRFIIPYIWLEGQSAPDPPDPPDLPDALEGIEIGEGGTIFPGVLTQNRSGFGDTTYQGFFSPAEPGKMIWGLGPVLVLPTHTDDALGGQ